MTCDASQTGRSAVITQIDETGFHPLSFTSRKLNEAEQNYKTSERELLAIIYALQTWRPYLHDAKFTIFTDHHPLKYLDEQKTLSRKQARWVEFMQEFDYILKCIKGKSNIVADALYRKDKEVHMTSSNVVRQLMNLITIKLSEKMLSKLKYD